MEEKKPEISSSLETFQLTLEEEESHERQGEKIVVSKDKEGHIQYDRNDTVGLMGLLGHFDTRLHVLKDYKVWLKVRDRLIQSYLDHSKVLSLSIDQASFLKDFLTHLPEKDCKDVPLPEFETRTLVGLIEQFESK